MLGIPAKLAGCKEIVICTPPNSEGKVHSAILYTADLLGISKIYKVGGAQAIAAMAYGTETIPKVDKIFDEEKYPTYDSFKKFWNKTYPTTKIENSFKSQ
jgi:hypothetical protein